MVTTSNIWNSLAMKPASRESERFCQGEKSDEDLGEDLGGAEFDMLRKAFLD